MMRTREENTELLHTYISMYQLIVFISTPGQYSFNCTSVCFISINMKWSFSLLYIRCDVSFCCCCCWWCCCYWCCFLILTFSPNTCIRYESQPIVLLVTDESGKLDRCRSDTQLRLSAHRTSCLKCEGKISAPVISNLLYRVQRY